ncbi:hypothetical protein [Cobetia sp. L2A1]|uniref:hypothetical protein n=1 Tax=Cobetia sp. L2A1 TaxID=2686360 RepID=UPI00131B73B4|nr:hypothetical protein [Cobetia sp. L2A1]
MSTQVATAEPLDFYAEKHSRMNMTLAWIALAILVVGFLFTISQNMPSASFAPLVMAIVICFMHGNAYKKKPAAILASDHVSLLLNPLAGRKLALYKEVTGLTLKKGKVCSIKYVQSDDAKSREKTLKLSLNMFDEGQRNPLMEELSVRTGCDIQRV